MNAFLDQQYFNWLYGQVCSVKRKNPSRTYRNLLHILYIKEFVWLVPNDDNRVEDGKYLRYEFLEDEGITLKPRDQLWMELGCSFLEFMVALARRADFEADGGVDLWFWELLENIGLDRSLNDRVEIDREKVDDILDRVIWRTYEPDGTGGLFPLMNPTQDQRKVELWYQLNSYILERG